MPTEATDILSAVVGFNPSHLPIRKQQKEGRKVATVLKPRTQHTHSLSERPHSLADLKMYKDTKILVAKFLEHSTCSLPLDVQQVVNNIKCVIKLDEKHMEEAIFSANVIDQVKKPNLHAVIMCSNFAISVFICENQYTRLKDISLAFLCGCTCQMHEN